LSPGSTSQTPEDAWPELNWPDWQDTGDTLHRWIQIVGKVRMALSPMVNHWWQVALYVNSRGLTTSPIPYGAGSFDVTFDFIGHILLIETSNGARERFALTAMSVAAFHSEFFASLRRLGIDVHIWTMPSEILDAVPFQEDYSHASYDAAAAQRFWHVLVQCHRVFVLPYQAVREAPDPARALMGFLQQTYAAAADGAGWDRAALERAPSPAA